MSSAEPSFPTGNLPDRLTHLAQLDDPLLRRDYFRYGNERKSFGHGVSPEFHHNNRNARPILVSIMGGILVVSSVWWAGCC
jgi:hypothetical protein